MKTEPERRVHVRRYRVAAATLGVSAMMALAAAGGWWLRGALDDDEIPRDQIAVSVDRPIIVQTEANDDLASTPNVIGLRVDQARQVLVDAGFAAEQIVEQATPAGGESGIAIGQDPAPRTPRPEVVTLFVSEVTATPDLVGSTLDDARAALQQLGVRVTVERRYDPAVREGAILATAPPAGEALPAEVQVTVSSAPSAVFTAALRETERDGCSNRTVSLGDVSYSFGIQCSASPDGALVEYALTDGVTTFEATIGPSIQNDAVPITFEIQADGVTVFAATLGLGDVQDVAVPVLGAQRLRIVMTRPETEDRVTATALLGDPRLLGSRGAIDTLENETGR
ncbi:MAG: PASTA domain-containing protein [Actinomycetota bacterium]